MSTIAFLSANAIPILSAFLFTYRVVRLPDTVDSLLCWFIFYFAQIVTSQLLLGVFGVLYFHNVIFLNCAILLILWLFAKKQPPVVAPKQEEGFLKSVLEHRTLLFGLSLLLGFGLVKIAVNLINPPFGWDDLNYHFTFPVEWFKHGNLDTPIVIADDPSPPYYPINGSLFFLWLIFPFKSVFIADLGQIPFFIACFLSVYSLAGKVSMEKRIAFFAACLFTFIPNYFKQTEIAYVDVMVTAMFLAALNWLFILNEDLSLKNVFVYSLAVGLLAGIKTLALPYAFLLFIPFLYLCSKNIDKGVPLIAFSVAVILLTGGFSYIRNAIITGNPLYPWDLSLLGHPVFKGVMDRAVYTAHFALRDYRLDKILFHEGLGAQTLLFVFPAVFFALPATFVKQRNAGGFLVRYCMALPLLLYLVYRYVIPLANVRYLYSLLAVGMLGGFYLANTLKLPWRIISALAILCLLSSSIEIAKKQELIAAFMVSLFLFFFLRIFIKRRVFMAAVAAVLICALPLLEKDYIKNEYTRYVKMQKYSGFWPEATVAWEWLNRNTVGNNIAYAGRPVPFPLYGTNFKNNVFYVSVNKVEPAKLHFFPNSHYRWGPDFLSLHRALEEKDNYRGNADYGVWHGNLLNRKTDYLFIYSLHQTKDVIFPLEDEWARARPDTFIPVFSSSTIHIYRIAK